MRASLLIRTDRDYHRLFLGGLRSAGYIVCDEPNLEPDSTDVLILWNRLPTQDQIAKRYESVGAKVVIAENGWIGDTYALCLNNHNGAGTWHVGKESRWPSFGIEVKPWRAKGDHILVIPQRGMGVPPAAMPRDWTPLALKRLEKRTSRPIKVRYPQFRDEPLEPDFKDCHAVVTWASGAGIKAIVAGYPVFYEMSQWIGSYAARPFYSDLEKPYLGERETMLHRLSWAMWRPSEIESGEAFRCVLQSTNQTAHAHN